LIWPRKRVQAVVQFWLLLDKCKDLVTLSWFLLFFGILVCFNQSHNDSLRSRSQCGIASSCFWTGSRAASGVAPGVAWAVEWLINDEQRASVIESELGRLGLFDDD
jgi:hypothetical protein